MALTFVSFRLAPPPPQRDLVSILSYDVDLTRNPAESFENSTGQVELAIERSRALSRFEAFAFSSDRAEIPSPSVPCLANPSSFLWILPRSRPYCSCPMYNMSWASAYHHEHWVEQPNSFARRLTQQSVYVSLIRELFRVLLAVRCRRWMDRGQTQFNLT